MRRKRAPWGWIARVRAGAVVLLSIAALPAMGAAQRDTVPGVELGIVYESGGQPVLAVSPFAGGPGVEALAGVVQGIVGRDLRFSSRFTVLDSLPASLVGGDGGVDGVEQTGTGRSR